MNLMVESDDDYDLGGGRGGNIMRYVDRGEGEKL